MAGRMVSPNDMMEAAKVAMINGRDPQSEIEWIMLVNFFAFNMPIEVAENGCLLMKTIFDIPLDDETIIGIAERQNESKAKDRK